MQLVLAHGVWEAAARRIECHPYASVFGLVAPEALLASHNAMPLHCPASAGLPPGLCRVFAGPVPVLCRAAGSRRGPRRCHRY